MRQKGHYWVMLASNPGFWEVGYWNSDHNYWTLTGVQKHFSDDDFSRITSLIQEPPVGYIN